MGAEVTLHYTNTGGLDIDASLNGTKIIGEAINWYGGYIHPKRFINIIRKLSEKSEIKLFICYGVKPSKEQKRILEAMNVHIIFYPQQILKVTQAITNYLNSNIFAVITSILYNSKSSNVVNSSCSISGLSAYSVVPPENFVLHDCENSSFTQNATREYEKFNGSGIVPFNQVYHTCPDIYGKHEV